MLAQNRSPESHSNLGYPMSRFHRKDNLGQRQLNFHLASSHPPPAPYHHPSNRQFPHQHPVPRQPYPVQQQQLPQQHSQLPQQQPPQLSPAFPQAPNHSFFPTSHSHPSQHSPNTDNMCPDQPIPGLEGATPLRSVPHFNAPHNRPFNFIEDNTSGAGMGEILGKQHFVDDSN